MDSPGMSSSEEVLVSSADTEEPPIKTENANFLDEVEEESFVLSRKIHRSQMARLPGVGYVDGKVCYSNEHYKQMSVFLFNLLYCQGKQNSKKITRTHPYNRSLLWMKERLKRALDPSVKNPGRGLVPGYAASLDEETLLNDGPSSTAADSVKLEGGGGDCSSMNHASASGNPRVDGKIVSDKDNVAAPANPWSLKKVYERSGVNPSVLHSADEAQKNHGYFANDDNIGITFF